MKVKLEISEGLPNEVVIRASSLSDEVRRIETLLSSALTSDTIELSRGDTDYYIPLNEILFFETDDGRVTAHTEKRMFYSGEKIYTLCRTLPRCFVRVSKSCIVNVSKVESVCRGVTGNAEVRFTNGDKKVYVSRMYYAAFKQAIQDMRL